MTTEEAIEMLKRWVKSYRYVASKDKNGFWAKNYRKDAEALEMAIEALETKQEIAEAWAEDHCAECKFRRGRAMSDYISRDVTYTLAKRINDKIINGEYHAATFGGVILDMIDELPPADVVEVKHAKWTNHVHYLEQDCKIQFYVCSNCGMPRPLPAMENLYFSMFNFCPKCGSDMRETT